MTITTFFGDFRSLVILHDLVFLEIQIDTHPVGAFAPSLPEL
jgi:hypothetical protein